MQRRRRRSNSEIWASKFRTQNFKKAFKKCKNNQIVKKILTPFSPYQLFEIILIEIATSLNEVEF